MSQEPVPIVPRPLDVGAELRQAREHRGESLLQAADRTKISSRYLEALERDAPLSEFPAPTYARFFLREYCRHLGIDEAPVLAAFARANGMADPEVAEDALDAVGPAGPPPPAPAGRRTPRHLDPPGLARIRAGRGGQSSPEGLARLRALAEALGPTGGWQSGRSTLRFERRPQPGMWGRLVLRLVAVLALAALAGGVVYLAVDRVRSQPTGGPEASDTSDSPQARGPALNLPRGGRRIFPEFRVIAYYGIPNTTTLGILGVGPDEAGRRLQRQAAEYRTPNRKILPAFELIATVALGQPGEDGMYRSRQSKDQIRAYLEGVRKIKGLLILDVQPGRSDFFSEIQVLEEFLRQPDVGLALDPEWHVGPNEVPGQDLGSVDAATVNQIVRYLADIVKEYNLPQKLLVIHRFTDDMIRNIKRIKHPAEVAVTIDVDGYGDRAHKSVKYQTFLTEDDGFYHGIKLYFRQDTGLMTPEDVLFLQPEPDLVVYQ